MPSIPWDQIDIAQARGSHRSIMSANTMQGQISSYAYQIEITSQSTKVSSIMIRQLNHESAYMYIYIVRVIHDIIYIDIANTLGTDMLIS